MSKTVLEVASKTVRFLESVNVQNKAIVESIVLSATGLKMSEHLSERQLELLFNDYIIAKIREEEPKRRYTTAALGCNIGLNKRAVERLMELAGLVERDSVGDLHLTLYGTEFGKVEDGKLMWLQCTNRILRTYK